MQAQNITGQIVDETGIPLIGANVVVQGTTTGTVTDIDGNFSLKANKEDVLEISYLGYEKMMITVGDESNLSLKMKPDAATLDELVVRTAQVL